MKLSKIGLIIGREYSVRVKKKSFILVTILTPILMALLILVPSLIMLYNGEDQQTVMIVDRSGLLPPYFQTNESTAYEFSDADVDVDRLKSDYDNLSINALVVVS